MQTHHSEFMKHPGVSVLTELIGLTRVELDQVTHVWNMVC